MRIEPNPTRLIDQFIPVADVAERHETLVHAPADLLLDVAQSFDLQSIPLVRTLFRLRALLLGAERPATDLFEKGLIAETKALGWGELGARPGREIVMGAVTQPWRASVTFTPIAPPLFAAFAEPNLVKIVWTLEVDALGPAISRFRTETRVRATDDEARRKFLRYWRWAGVGIVLIRWLLLPALRRAAERRFDLQARSGSTTPMYGNAR